MTGVPVHACPRQGEWVTPCCGRSPHELLAHRITLDATLVTCTGPKGGPSIRRPVLPTVSVEAQALAALLRLDGDGRAVAVDALHTLTPDGLRSVARAARRLADLADQELDHARSMTEAHR